MKAKIFGKLKQEYSSLGLGDEILMSRADSIAATGLVTNDNIDAVVAAQRSDLESLQSRADKRVTEALEKERKKHEAEMAQKIKSAEDALRRKLTEEKESEAKQEPPAPQDKPESLSDPRLEELQKQIAQLISEREKADAASKSARENLEKQIKELADKNAANEAAALKAAHQAKILAKAKELGVPQWRIDEGFTIADDATDETIAETLGKVANNIRANSLPGNGNGFPLGNDKPSDEEIKSLAAKIVI